MQRKRLLLVATAIVLGCVLVSSPSLADPPAEDCTGDHDHWGHGWSASTCYHHHGPHYPKDVEPDKACSLKAKNCGACNNCCGSVTDQTQNCECAFMGLGKDACDNMAIHAQRTCEDVCLGTYLDAC